MKRIARHIKYDIYGYITKEMDAFHAGTRYYPKQFGIWWWDKQPYEGMDRANRTLAAGHWNNQNDIEEGFMNDGKWTTLKEANMAFEAKKILKKIYPALPKGTNIDTIFTQEELNTTRINFLEAIIIDLKKDMGAMYKAKKDYEPEDFDWLMGEFREQKNKAEHDKKIVILEQKYLRDGLNLPFMWDENKYLYNPELQTPEDPR